MINPELHKQPAGLDREKHRHWKLRADRSNLRATAGLNSFFLTTAEFGDACREYPILFLQAAAGADGKPQVAPVAVFGVTPGENLFLGEGNDWAADYVPAMLRAYPFTMARVGVDQFAMVIDEGWEGFSTEEGRPLFDDQGEPTPLLLDLRKFVEQIEVEIERTRLAGIRLLELQLLLPKRFDATLADGETIVVDGFLAVDEERLAKLSDAEALELQRSGLLGLLHAHLISLGNMRRLLDRRTRRKALAPAAS